MRFEQREQSVVSRARGRQRVKREVQLLPVMRVEAEISELHRRISHFLQIAQQIAIAERLAHLAAVEKHKLSVHPVIDAPVSEPRLALRDFVFVMYGNMVDAARVDIEGLAQKLFTHCSALYVPAGETHPPRAVPLHNVVCGRFFPQREVGGMPFLLVYLHARAAFLLVEIYAGQLPVFGELFNGKINAVVRFVGEPLFQQRFDNFYHFGNIVRCLGRDGRS